MKPGLNISDSLLQSARPFALTAAGRAFLPHAEAMLDELEAFRKSR